MKLNFRQTIFQSINCGTLDNCRITGKVGKSSTESNTEVYLTFHLKVRASHLNAQTSLGWMYRKGLGVPQDDKTAVKWWRLAAEQGNATAQSNLGWMYLRGDGVPQDNAYAHMWWNIAASSGDKDAVKNRGVVAKRMIPSQIAEAQKLARECVRKKYKGC